MSAGDSAGVGPTRAAETDRSSRLPWSRGRRDLFPLHRVRLARAAHDTPADVVRRRSALNEAVDALTWLAGYKGDEGNELMSSFLFPLSLNDGLNDRPCMRSAFGDVLARLDLLIAKRSDSDAPSPEDCLQKF